MATIRKITEPEISSAPVVVVSYFCGLPGYVGAEWTDDKLRTLSESGREFVLVSSPSGMRNTASLHHYQISSLSRTDFLREKAERMSWKSQTVSWFDRPFGSMVATTLGWFVDAFLKKILGAHSDGRLTWSLSAAPLIIYLSIKYRRSTFLVLGGPSSAHLLGVLAGSLGVRVIVELQDPLLGDHMALSPSARKGLQILERLLLKKSKSVVFTSRGAHNEALRRQPELSSQMRTVYPGITSRRDCETLPNLPFGKTLVHMGTLYGSRNLDRVLEAVAKLRNSGVHEDVGVLNLGFVEPQLYKKYQRLDYFEVIPKLTRQEAICMTRAATASLLVQHLDSRASVTIPYKVYDYASSGMPTCLVLNSSEEVSEIVSHFSNFIVVKENLESALEAALSEEIPNPDVHDEQYLLMGTQLTKALEA